MESSKECENDSADILFDERNQTDRGSALTYYPYSRTAAVAYAAAWYDGVNPTFGAASQDCQSFASQVVWKGLGGYSTTSAPVVYDSVQPSSNSRLWQHNNYYSGQTPSFMGWHWDNVDGFFWLINTSSSSFEGPQGNIFYNLNYATEGDIIAYDKESTNPTIGELDHAMVVTDTTGNFGSRNVADIFIAAHNYVTTSAYEALNDYTNYGEAHFVTARITGGYYY